MSRKAVEVEGPTIVSGDDGRKFSFYKIDYIRTPLIFRKEDEWLIEPIFKEREYTIPINRFRPEFILDCGANIGTSAVYFANVYPDAKILSVEPDTENFELLKLNTSPYPNIKCIKSALWNKETYVGLTGYPPAAFMTYETNADDPKAIKTTTISKLFADSGFAMIDLLKIDIEGAEKEVFEAPDIHDWLSKVKVIAIELHDRFKLGCSKAVFSALIKYDFFLWQCGENLIFIREEMIRDDFNKHASMRAQTIGS